MKKRAPEYRSYRNGNTDRKIGKCKCGHSGDGSDTEHEDQEIGSGGFKVYGHGKCKLCKCPMFTWAGWMKT